VTFERFVASKGQSLMRLAFVLCGDRHQAEDLTQVVLTKAYRKWRQIETAESPDAYVRKILVNTFVSWRRLKSSHEVLVGDVPDDIADNAPGNDDLADVIASFDYAKQLLSRLSRQSRAILVLRYYADLDDAAIASELGISQSSVRSTASRALATLRTVLVDAKEEQ